jgi:hypothetical protein
VEVLNTQMEMGSDTVEADRDEKSRRGCVGMVRSGKDVEGCMGQSRFLAGLTKRRTVEAAQRKAFGERLAWSVPCKRSSLLVRWGIGESQ